jgi:hypothetical protein
MAINNLSKAQRAAITHKVVEVGQSLFEKMNKGEITEQEFTDQVVDHFETEDEKEVAKYHMLNYKLAPVPLFKIMTDGYPIR